MESALEYPFDVGKILRHKIRLRSALTSRLDEHAIEVRVAILGGSTTSEVRDQLELFLLKGGIRPAFYESDYDAFYTDVVFENPRLVAFRPDVVYIHTTYRNVRTFPSPTDSEVDVENLLGTELSRFTAIWDKLEAAIGCSIIQNNFEWPPERPLGNLDSYDFRGRIHFLAHLNAEFAEHARRRPSLYLNDINYLASVRGLDRWHNPRLWHAYRYAVDHDSIPHIAHSVGSIIHSLYGCAKKALVLDLDNTLWGGVIGDDGIAGINIGPGDPSGEAYAAFQDYLDSLHARGIVLTVCSKNEVRTAQEGFSHPDSVLALDHFAAFYADWEHKPENILRIAADLNLGLDSLVFVDDNPAERAIVRERLPTVAVPEVSEDVTDYISYLDRSGYFEPVTLSQEDLNRSLDYRAEVDRNEVSSNFVDYGDFLASLAMELEVGAFSEVYLDRITQLLNKTNQFNLVTKRYSIGEVGEIGSDEHFITLYGKLSDKFGSSGLVSAIIAEVKGDEAHVESWVMSCRVFKRNLELSMFDALAERCLARRVRRIVGHYASTERNGIVEYFYRDLGFMPMSSMEAGRTVWSMEIAAPYDLKNPSLIAKAS